MEQQSIVTTSTLEIQNLQYAHEQYDDFVDIHFIEVDRQMLQLIGFKNTFNEKKDKHGNIILDEHGNPLLVDKRHDFSNAIRFLRNSSGFNEGTSLEDCNAHFVIQRVKNNAQQNQQNRHGGAGLNKLSIWLRKDMFQKWVHIIEIKNSTNKKNNNGLIYFIHMENNMKVFKIGYTTDLKRRLEALQVAHPYSLHVYATIENVSKKQETELHHLFKKNHVRGEWFAITPDIIDLVCKNNTNL